MSKKVVTVEQLLENARQAEALNVRLAEEVAIELAQRPTEAEVTAEINAAIGDIEEALAAI